MKTQQQNSETDKAQGTLTVNNALNQSGTQKHNSGSNADSQRANQTSNKNVVHKPERKMPLL